MVLLRVAWRCQRTLCKCWKGHVIRQPFLLKAILALMVACALWLTYLSYSVSRSSNGSGTRASAGSGEGDVLPALPVRCQLPSGMMHFSCPGTANDHTINANASLKLDNRVLLLVETPFTSVGQDIRAMLEANKIRFKQEIAGKSLPNLTQRDKGKYGVVIFERLESYLNMDKWNQQLLDKYCRQYGIGMIAFASPAEQLTRVRVTGFPLHITSRLRLDRYELNAQSPLLRITRGGQEAVMGLMADDEWTSFEFNHSTYEAIAYASSLSPLSSSVASSQPFAPTENRGDDNVGTGETRSGSSVSDGRHVVAFRDKGEYDGVRRVVFGSGLRFWLHRTLFLDALSYLSYGQFSTDLERYILVDIDDVFIGKPGHRMTVDDVQALIAAQHKFSQMVENFHFNLGFSGKYFRQGTDDENEADDLLIANKDKFWWFDHTWSHIWAPNQSSAALLENEMIANHNFAAEYGIALSNGYSVAPHHAGVYPVHEQLYEAWYDMGVRVTSTEEYPHLRPARYRKGFIYKGIKVLPRQTCLLYTHTIFRKDFPGGPEKLDASVKGGELFQTILNNPISIFMTHEPNYANDRLALYTFEGLLKFIKCWTNLKLKTMAPAQLATLYFNMFPDEEQPVWRLPCNDKRHKEIWAPWKRCDRVPQVLVIGPQKTGTTALYSFLSIHPSIVSNYVSNTTFEEVQFFGGKNYLQGLDWYLEFFPRPPSAEPGSIVLFEKSANYFDSDVAPERAFALLPNVKLVCILISPAKRAYSWYQHQKAHGDAAATQHSFYDVITADDSAPRALRELRNHCLNPGVYSVHLNRWLDYFPAKQLLILDGEELKSSPIAVMDQVQLFLEVEPYLDYSQKLTFNLQKGFYCRLLKEGRTKCLGGGKGRRYLPMDTASEKYLRAYYRKHNIALSKLLHKLSVSEPGWLKDELTDYKDADTNAGV